MLLTIYAQTQPIHFVLKIFTIIEKNVIIDDKEEESNELVVEGKTHLKNKEDML